MAAKDAVWAASRSLEYPSVQGESAIVIYNGTFVCDWMGGPKLMTVAPPIQIFHPVLQEFSDRINDPKFQPDEEVVSYLMPRSSKIHSYGDANLARLRRFLTMLSQGHESSDDIIFRREQGCSIPLLVLEFGCATYEGGCDPSIQAAYSLRNMLYKDEVRTFFGVFYMSGRDVVPSSATFSTRLVVHPSFSVVPALICLYTVPSIRTSSSSITSSTSTSGR